MKIKIYPFIIAILILAFTSCKKSSPVLNKTITDTSKTDTSKKDTSASKVDVYVAGTSGGLSGHETVTYWKNGVPVLLGPGEGYSIAVSNGDVYVAGYYVTADGNNSVATYWKNGVPTKLADSTSSSLITSICIAGKDVYAVGIINLPDHGKTVYWKNGVLEYYTPTFGIGNIIIVNNGDVYIAGATNGAPTYWKNGVATTLDYDHKVSGELSTIAIDGNDIYAGGLIYANMATADLSANYVASCWKNGALTFLEDTLTYSYVLGSAMQNHTALFAGYTTAPNGNQIAAYWKNNAEVLLADSLSYSRATAMAANGNDVYIAGTYNTQAVYWKNGIINVLAKGAGATAIAIASHH